MTFNIMFAGTGRVTCIWVSLVIRSCCRNVQLQSQSSTITNHGYK